MTKSEFIKLFSEMIKQSIDNNPNMSEWEKWYRKTGVETTQKLAEEYYRGQEKWLKQLQLLSGIKINL